MTTKKNNIYKIRIDEVLLKDGTAGQKSLEFEFENHDDIFGIIQRMQKVDIFGDGAQAVEFAIGLKLFSEVLLNHKDNPLFEELKPAFQVFMKKLKGNSKQDRS
jgi:hypothetical protein